jgi:hypothetical protein
VTYTGIAGCFKRSFTTLEAYKNVFRGHIQCFYFCNIAKHSDFYMELLRFKVTSTGNAGCFKKSFIIIFQMLLCGECYENVCN